MLPRGSPLAEDGGVVNVVVGVLTDGGPEAATKQDTEKAVGVEPSARRRRKRRPLRSKSRRWEKHWRAPSPSKVAFEKAGFEDLISCPQEAAASSKNDVDGSQNSRGSSSIS